jgi:hypothetical protein
MSDTDNLWEFKAIAEKVLSDEDLTDYQRGWCHGQIDAADTMSEYLERQNQIAKAAPEMLEALKYLTKEVDACVNNAWLCKQTRYKEALAAIAKAEGRQP